MENALDSTDFKLEIGKTTNDKDRHHVHVWEFVLSSDLFKLKSSYDDDIYIEAFWSIQSFLTPTLPLALPTPIVYFVTRAAVAAVAPVPNFPAKTLVWWKMFYNSTGYVRSFFCGNFSTLKLHETTETTGYCLERIRSWLR